MTKKVQSLESRLYDLVSNGALVRQCCVCKKVGEYGKKEMIDYILPVGYKNVSHGYCDDDLKVLMGEIDDRA